MPQIDKSTLLFLADLKRHNDRDWFNENRKRYEAAKINYETFVQEVINSITMFDPIFRGLEAKSCTFRINRDIRFSTDKSIYKTHMGAFIVRAVKRTATNILAITCILNQVTASLQGEHTSLPPDGLKQFGRKLPNGVMSF